MAEALLNCLQGEWKMTGGMIDGARIAEFGIDSHEQWWLLAKRRLLQSYPEPEEIEELTSLVTAPSRKEYPSTMRQAIFRKLQTAFRALANKPG